MNLSQFTNRKSEIGTQYHKFHVDTPSCTSLLLPYLPLAVDCKHLFTAFGESLSMSESRRKMSDFSERAYQFTSKRFKEMILTTGNHKPIPKQCNPTQIFKIIVFDCIDLWMS